MMYLLNKNCHSKKTAIGYLFKFIVIFGFLTQSLYSISFTGRLFNDENGEPEKDMTVMIFETKKLYQTDANGYFRADVPASGEYTFRVLRPTGMQELKKAVAIEGENVTIYTAKKKVIPKGAIAVTGFKDKTVSSRYQVRYDEVKRMPGTNGEVLKGLETLPGIVAPTFGGGVIVIRGADPNSNLYLFDDLPIANPYHFGGFNSVVHNDIIKTMDVYTGAFPAHFYNATGGVIEIESIDDIKKAEGQASVSLFSVNSKYQTPIFDGKGYIVAGGRISMLRETIGRMGVVPDGIRLPQYNDSQVKIVYNFNEAHQISVYNLTSLDGFAVDFKNKKPSNDPSKENISDLYAGGEFSANNGFRTTAFRYTWTPNSKFTNRLTLIDYDPFYNVNVSFGTIKAETVANGAYTGVRQDAHWRAFKNLLVDFGSEGRILKYHATGSTIRQTDPNNLSPNPYDTTNPSFQTVPLNDTTNSRYGSAYTTMHIIIGNFKFEPATRYDYYEVVKKGAYGPRGVTSYKFKTFGKDSTIFAGGGQYNRIPFDPALSKESGNTKLNFEKSIKYNIGFEQKVTSEWSFKTEVFKQEFSSIIVNDPYISEPIGMNPDKYQWLTNPVVRNRPLNYSNKGDGWARGYEILIKKQNRPGSKDWFGWLSYTWSQTFRNNNIHVVTDDEKNLAVTGDEQRLRALYNNSKETFFDYDQTHIVNAVYGWRINEEWQFGARWRYLTSAPYTPITGDDGGKFQNPATGQTFWNPTYSKDVNSQRFKPYNRLDFRIDKFLNYEWGFMNVFVEINNVYVRKNQVSQDFNSLAPYSRTNPSKGTDFSTLNVGSTNIPLVNLGLEARF